MDNNNSKFSSLNFNLKNNIFKYLPIQQKIDKIPIISKKFFQSVKKSKSMKIFFENFGKFMKEIQFNKSIIEKIKSEFSNIWEEEEILDDIICFLLLNKNNKYESLDLREEKDLDFKMLGKYISEAKNIKSLDLYDTEIGRNEENLKLISYGLIKNKSIEKINFNRNQIGIFPNHMIYIKDILEKNETIKTIYFYENQIGNNENDFFYLAQGIENNQFIETISIDNNKINNFNRDVMGYLVNAVRKNKSLKEMRISVNDKLDIKKAKNKLKQANKNLRIK